MGELIVNGQSANSAGNNIEMIGYNTPATYKTLQDEMDEVKENLTNINVYVGEDKKLHFVNSEGADSVIPFNSGYDILEVGIIYFATTGQGDENMLATKKSDGSWTSYNWGTGTGEYLMKNYGYFAKKHIKCLVMQNGYYGNSVKIAEYQVDEKIIGQANGFGACVIVLEDLT